MTYSIVWLRLFYAERHNHAHFKVSVAGGWIGHVAHGARQGVVVREPAVHEQRAAQFDAADLGVRAADVLTGRLPGDIAGFAQSP